MKKEVIELQEKSKRSLNAAKMLHDRGDYDFSVSRSYYSLFYIAEALLLMKDKAFSKHSAVIAGFYNEYVKTGSLEKRIHSILNRAFDLRNKGDYWLKTPITAETSRQLLSDCEEFVKATEKFFKE